MRKLYKKKIAETDLEKAKDSRMRKIRDKEVVESFKTRTPNNVIFDEEHQS